MVFFVHQSRGRFPDGVYVLHLYPSLFFVVVVYGGLVLPRYGLSRSPLHLSHCAKEWSSETCELSATFFLLLPLVACSTSVCISLCPCARLRVRSHLWVSVCISVCSCASRCVRVHLFVSMCTSSMPVCTSTCPCAPLCAPVHLCVPAGISPCPCAFFHVCAHLFVSVCISSCPRASRFVFVHLNFSCVPPFKVARIARKCGAACGLSIIGGSDTETGGSAAATGT